MYYELKKNKSRLKTSELLGVTKKIKLKSQVKVKKIINKKCLNSKT